MRNIPVSTGVYAAIWSKRQKGEETEDAILARLLGATPEPPAKSSEIAVGTTLQIPQWGMSIAEFGVELDDGFEIFRDYKGTRFVARVDHGEWFLTNNGKRYPSLHKLSDAVVNHRENSWNNWKYRTAKGTVEIIDTLRKRSTIKRRT